MSYSTLVYVVHQLAILYSIFTYMLVPSGIY